MLVTPGVHSLPEKVLNDQQTNIPNRRFFRASTRAFDTPVEDAALVWAFNRTTDGVARSKAKPVPVTRRVVNCFMDLVSGIIFGVILMLLEYGQNCTDFDLGAYPYIHLVY